ncbi:MAG: hypothetical protein ACRC20_09650 [Segniliparus sp.]|uniref:hypothetical protein n=1 Tax=Segniliparus sp. TaxID=2804064 RepID=UPI003F3F7DD2
MTRYAVDRDEGVLIAAWGTGRGDVAKSVARSSSDELEALVVLAGKLSRLCEQLWRCYVFPASAYENVEVNTEGWRQQESRRAFAEVLSVIEARGERAKQRESGFVESSYDPVLNAAEQVADALSAFSDAEFGRAVEAEVREELAAVERAELGDLSGRAQQAVLLSRVEASPVQVHAADQILRENPLGSTDLFTLIEPTAAAVAAARWLRAAASVAADESGRELTGVVIEADDIEALPVETPTRVLELLDLGVPAHEVVADLVREALFAAEGRIANLSDLEEVIAIVNENAKPYREAQPRTYDALRAEVRVSLLDPRRPALDLLEDLLSGIYGCWLVYREYSDGGHGSYDDDDFDEEDFDEEDDEEAFDEDDRSYEEQRSRFVEAVRERGGAL